MSEINYLEERVTRYGTLVIPWVKIYHVTACLMFECFVCDVYCYFYLICTPRNGMTRSSNLNWRSAVFEYFKLIGWQAVGYLGLSIKGSAQLVSRPLPKKGGLV